MALKSHIIIIVWNLFVPESRLTTHLQQIRWDTIILLKVSILGRGKFRQCGRALIFITNSQSCLYVCMYFYLYLLCGAIGH